MVTKRDRESLHHLFVTPFVRTNEEVEEDRDGCHSIKALLHVWDQDKTFRAIYKQSRRQGCEADWSLFYAASCALEDIADVMLADLARLCLPRTPRK